MSTCERCKGSGIDPDSYTGSYGDWSWEPPALEPCTDCQYGDLPANGPCHCGATVWSACGPAACAWNGPEDCVWDHGQDNCWGK